MLKDVDYRLDTGIVAAQGVLNAVTAKLCDYVCAIPEFANAEACEVTCEDGPDFSHQLDRVADGHCPLLIVARITSAEDKAHGVPGVMRLDPLKVAVDVYENPAANRSKGGAGITCTKAAELIAKHLKCRRIARSYLASPTLTEKESTDTAFESVQGKSIGFTLSIEI